MMNVKTGSIILICFFYSLAAEKTFSITGVSINDSLNIREGDSARSGIVAKIPSDARGIVALSDVKMNGSVEWRKIKFNKHVGWVNSRFLKEDGAEYFKENIKCTGTEPFWSMQIKNGEMVLQFPMGEIRKYNLTKVRQSNNNTDHWYIEGTSTKIEKIAVYLIQQKCSDGMSDIEYKYQVLVYDSKTDGAICGCCTPLE